MSDTTNKLYEILIHCNRTVLNECVGSADAVALFNRQTLLRMGLAETWVITRTSQEYGTSKNIPEY